MSVNAVKNAIPTIDVSLVTASYEVTSGGSSSTVEIAFDTANQIEVEPQTEEQDAVKLVIKGKLKAQKPQSVTITGHQITLHDNVFIPELVRLNIGRMQIILNLVKQKPIMVWLVILRLLLVLMKRVKYLLLTHILLFIMPLVLLQVMKRQCILTVQVFL